MEKLTNGRYKTAHHPQGIDESKLFFNEQEVTALVLEWQQSGRIETWHAIVHASLPLIDTVIRTYKFQRYDDIDALRNECVLKLARMLNKYNPDKGSTFSFFNVGLKRFLVTYAYSEQRRLERTITTEDTILQNQAGRAQMMEGLSEETKASIRNIQTRFKTPEQREALKFLINYFLLEGFSLPKTSIIQTLHSSFHITYGLAQILYDYALISLRVSLRVAIRGEHQCRFSSLEMLRLSNRFSVIPEMAELIGMSNLKKLVDIYGGITVTFPTRADLERLAKEQTRLTQVKKSPCPPKSVNGREPEFLTEISEEHHITEPLFVEEGVTP